MREFRVTLTHKAGELARLCELLASHDLDLRSVAGMTLGNRAEICLVASDVAAMRAEASDSTAKHWKSGIKDQRSPTFSTSPSEP